MKNGRTVRIAKDSGMRSEAKKSIRVGGATSVMKIKDSKRYCDTTMPESIHTKDESKRGSAFAFIFGVN